MTQRQTLHSHCSEQSADVRREATIAIMKVNRWTGHCVGSVQCSSVRVAVCRVDVVAAGRCKSENKLKYGQSFCYGGFVESFRSRQSLVTVPFVFLRRLGNNLQSQSVNKIRFPSLQLPSRRCRGSKGVGEKKVVVIYVFMESWVAHKSNFRLESFVFWWQIWLVNTSRCRVFCEWQFTQRFPRRVRPQRETVRA